MNYLDQDVWSLTQIKKLKLEKTKKEKGCVKPLYGVKSKCVINIVPKTKKCKSFTIDKRCKLEGKND